MTRLTLTKTKLLPSSLPAFILQVSAAFAMISFSNGMATATGFFTFTSMPRNTMATICGCFGVVGLVSYIKMAYFMTDPKLKGYEATATF